MLPEDLQVHRHILHLHVLLLWYKLLHLRFLFALFRLLESLLLVVIVFHCFAQENMLFHLGNAIQQVPIAGFFLTQDGLYYVELGVVMLRLQVTVSAYPGDTQHVQSLSKLTENCGSVDLPKRGIFVNDLLEAQKQGCKDT